MPKGLKATSSPIQISSSVTETGPNTFTIQEIDLSLNALDNEVFVVTQVNLDVDAPDLVAGQTTIVQATLSTTSRLNAGNVGSIADQNVLGSAERIIVMAAATTADGGLQFDREDPTFTSLSEDYIGIIATSNAYLNVEGRSNGNAKQVRCRLFGYRAQADASVYAALVQSEVLSA